jgi:hypothetical protein
MISRSVPLPPPPADGGADDAALLVERAAAMTRLVRRGLALKRLLLLWGTGAGAVLGWAAVGLAVQEFQAGGLGALGGLVALVLGGVLLVPAAVVAGFWLAKGPVFRRELDEWADRGSLPVTDVGLRAQAGCVLWLLPSAALAVVGAVLTGMGATRAGSVTVGEMVYTMGSGGTVLLTGLFGAFQAVAHQRWSGQLLTAVPFRRGGGAHR